MQSQDLSSVKFNRRYFVQNPESSQDQTHHYWVLDASASGLIIYTDPINQAEKYLPDIEIDFETSQTLFTETYTQTILEKLSQGFREVSEIEFYQEALRSLKQKLLEKSLQKPAWIPILNAKESVDWSHDSYYGGASYLKGYDYPQCQSLCNDPLSHFLQINLAQLPVDSDFPIKEGLIKIFYCTNLVSECSDCSPHQEYKKPWYQFIYIPPDKMSDIEFFPEKSSSPTKKISHWQSLPMELPTYKDFADGFDITSLPFDATEAEKYAYMCLLDDVQDQDKLGGYPVWIQYQNYLICSDCQTPMKYLYQLDSGGHTEFYFGSGGIGHVFLCPNDFKVFFMWDCT